MHVSTWLLLRRRNTRSAHSNGPDAVGTELDRSWNWSVTVSLISRYYTGLIWGCGGGTKACQRVWGWRRNEEIRDSDENDKNLSAADGTTITAADQDSGPLGHYLCLFPLGSCTGPRKRGPTDLENVICLSVHYLSIWWSGVPICDGTTVDERGWHAYDIIFVYFVVGKA